MLGRRQAIMASLLFAAREVMGQEVYKFTSPSTAILDIKVDADMSVLALRIRYKGREAKVSMDEVMDALGAVPIPEEKKQ